MDVSKRFWYRYIDREVREDGVKGSEKDVGICYGGGI